MIKLFRVILPVKNIEEAALFYRTLLEAEGHRVSPGRHYFACGEVILACFDPRADGDPWDAAPNPEHLYFSVNDIERVLTRAIESGAIISRPIETQPWGERSFYCIDPFGNKLCFVAADTVFSGGLLQ